MMNKNLYDFLSSNPPVVWYPFCENSHTTGYTPNVANGSDGSTLRAALLHYGGTGFDPGEICGGGRMVLINSVGSYLMTSSRPELQIQGDLTILFWHRIVDSVSYTTMTVCYSPTSNTLYRIIRDGAGNILMSHEYGSGTDTTVSTGIVFPWDDSINFLAIRRDATLLQYETRLNDSSFVSSISYPSNPTGGSESSLRIPVESGGPLQADGQYYSVMIFNNKLSDDSVNLIYNSGLPSANWFDYSGWDGSSGTGYVTYVPDLPIDRNLTLFSATGSGKNLHINSVNGLCTIFPAGGDNIDDSTDHKIVAGESVSLTDYTMGKWAIV